MKKSVMILLFAWCGWSSAVTSVKDPSRIHLLSNSLLGGASVDGWCKTPVQTSSDGSVYLATRTNSEDLPPAPGWDPTYNGFGDVLVARFDPQLTQLLGLTYLGGTGADVQYPGACMALASDGSVFVAASTRSDDFPVTEGTLITEPMGNEDVFVARFTGDLSTLLCATRLGGKNAERPHALIINRQGQIVVTGRTKSTDFPITSGAYVSPSKGKEDLFITLLDPDLTTVMQSSVFGGSGEDYPEAIVQEDDGTYALTGWTTSVNLPTTSGVLASTQRGSNYDAFVLRVSEGLTDLLACTYLGGSGWDFMYDLELDSDGSIWVCGHTTSTDYPVSQQAHDRLHNGSDDVVVTHLSANLSTLLHSTFYGGQGWENANSLTLLPEGGVLVGGSTSSTDLPCGDLAWDPDAQGQSTYTAEGFLLQMDRELAQIQDATYWGGSDSDLVASVWGSPDGLIYVGGFTSSSDAPLLDLGFSVSFSGGENEWGGDAVILVLGDEWPAQELDFDDLFVQYLPHFTMLDGQWRTTLSWVNPSDETAEVLLAAYGDSGNLLGYQSLSMAPGASRCEDVGAFFPDLDEERGWIKLGCSHPELRGIMQFTFLPSGGSSSLPLIAGGGSTLVFPSLINDASWSSGLALLNLGEAPQDVDIVFVQMDGEILAQSELDLQPGQKVVGMSQDMAGGVLPARCYALVTAPASISGFGLSFSAGNLQIVALPAEVLP